MYKIYKLFAILCVAFILFLSLIGFLSRPEENLTFTVLIESPSTVVWQYLTDPDKILQWRKDMDKLEILYRQEIKDGAVLRFYHENLECQEKIIEWVPENKMMLQRIGKTSYPLLKNFIT